MAEIKFPPNPPFLLISPYFAILELEIWENLLAKNVRLHCRKIRRFPN